MPLISRKEFVFFPSVRLTKKSVRYTKVWIKNFVKTTGSVSDISMHFTNWGKMRKLINSWKRMGE